ncbi:Uncharacterised protein [Mycobacteroides abscessus subsp. abscessus]|nr:Uncharacterised protein [Mycobacteroides abscessus subsp. abscessus]
MSPDTCCWVSATKASSERFSGTSSAHFWSVRRL